MTDGEPTAGSITDPDEIIQNIQSKNSVDARIFMFGLGSDINLELIDGLSQQNDGVSVYVQDSDDLSTAMSRYAQFFTSEVEAELSWSFPYVDAAGSGLIVSASKAVLVDDKLFGIVDKL